MTQIAFAGVGVDFGATRLFSDVSFTVARGERWGIVGRNGTGKTTLFRLLTGDLEPTRGNITRTPGLRVSLLEQHRDYGAATTVWEAAAGELAELLALEQSLVEQAANLAHDSSPRALARYGEDLERFEREGGYAVTARIDAVLHGLEFDPAQARVTPLSALSGGELGRLGLARQLMSTADVLLLDEPTNHLDLETTQWLEQYLAASERTVLLVSHDRAFLSATVDHVLHFKGGTATPDSARYSHFAAHRAERRLAKKRAIQQPLHGGELRLGASITTGYYRQDLSQVPLDGTLYEVIAALRPKWERGQIQGHLGRFGFSGQEVLRRADSLSGGERARVALAMLMLSGANLLILDEPTNHLDVESIEALEDAIDGYDGTVILVSHDRALLRALTTRIWILHGRHMTEFAGGYAEWEEVSTERAHAAAVSAAEEQALRQVHERHRVAPSPKSDPRKDLRRAQRELEEAEAAVAALESEVARVVAALEDPALYTRPDGAATARTLGAQLETLKHDLDAGLERWTRATEQVEMRAPR